MDAFFGCFLYRFRADFALLLAWEECARRKSRRLVRISRGVAHVSAPLRTDGHHVEKRTFPRRHEASLIDQHTSAIYGAIKVAAVACSTMKKAFSIGLSLDSRL